MSETINVTLEQDALSAVRESVEAGDFATEGEALSDAVRVWTLAREERAERLEHIKARLRRSIEDPRRSLTSEEMRESMTRWYAEISPTRS